MKKELPCVQELTRRQAPGVTLQGVAGAEIGLCQAVTPPAQRAGRWHHQPPSPSFSILFRMPWSSGTEPQLSPLLG